MSLRFGRHVRSCRRGRGMTQEALAAASGLSADTIQGVEHGNSSPSLDTLRKLCRGFDVQVSTLFDSFEHDERNDARAMADGLASLTPEEGRVLFQFVTMLQQRLGDDEK